MTEETVPGSTLKMTKKQVKNMKRRKLQMQRDHGPVFAEYSSKLDNLTYVDGEDTNPNNPWQLVVNKKREKMIKWKRGKIARDRWFDFHSPQIINGKEVFNPRRTPQQYWWY
uniref:Uncharacterized protein n=1 Tax=viral metagenome TaxID=1070528 RepID=A0A6C0CKE7_9ZZZZ